MSTNSKGRSRSGPRVRTGCRNCRQRKVKCDENGRTTQTPCTNCKRLKLDCSYVKGPQFEHYQQPFSSPSSSIPVQNSRHLTDNNIPVTSSPSMQQLPNMHHHPQQQQQQQQHDNNNMSLNQSPFTFFYDPQPPLSAPHPQFGPQFFQPLEQQSLQHLQQPLQQQQQQQHQHHQDPLLNRLPAEDLAGINLWDLFSFDPSNSPSGGSAHEANSQSSTSPQQPTADFSIPSAISAAAAGTTTTSSTVNNSSPPPVTVPPTSSLTTINTSHPSFSSSSSSSYQFPTFDTYHHHKLSENNVPPSPSSSTTTTTTAAAPSATSTSTSSSSSLTDYLNHQISRASNYLGRSITPYERRILKHFITTTFPPIVISADADWKKIRFNLIEMASQCRELFLSILSFSDLHLARLENRTPTQAITYYEQASQTLESIAAKASSSPEITIPVKTLKHALYSTFLLAYIDILLPQPTRPGTHAHTHLRWAHIFVNRLRTVITNKTTVWQAQLISWLTLLDAKAVFNGSEGLFLNDPPPEELSVSQIKDEDVDNSNNNNNNSNNSNNSNNNTTNNNNAATSTTTTTSTDNDNNIKFNRNDTSSAITEIQNSISSSSLKSLSVQEPFSIITAHDIIYNTLNYPVLSFHLRAQLFIGRIVNIDRWHRARGTPKDENEVFQIGQKINSDLHALWRNRPRILDFVFNPDPPEIEHHHHQSSSPPPYTRVKLDDEDPADQVGNNTSRSNGGGHKRRRRYSSEKPPTNTEIGLNTFLDYTIASRLSKAFRTYITNFFAFFIFLHRVAFHYDPKSEDVKYAIKQIKYQVHKLFDENLNHYHQASSSTSTITTSTTTTTTTTNNPVVTSSSPNDNGQHQHQIHQQQQSQHEEKGNNECENYQELEQDSNIEYNVEASLLWPLFMCGMECEPQELDWIISKMKLVESVQRAATASKTVSLLLEIVKRERQTGKRADSRMVQREMFGADFVII